MSKRSEMIAWKKELEDMSHCPNCHAVQNPPRDINNPDRHDCVNGCGGYISWNKRLKVPRAQWRNENWD